MRSQGKLRRLLGKQTHTYRVPKECNAWKWACLPGIVGLLAGCSSPAHEGLTIPVAGDAPPASTAKVEPGRSEFRRICMGVLTRIVIYSDDPQGAEDAAAGAFRLIGDLEAVMSDYRAHSDLNRLCERAVGVAMPVREELYDILTKAQRISLETRGAFDVTVGPAVALWRRARQTGTLPTDAEVSAARRVIGWEMVKLEPPDRVRLVKEGMKLDLGGIAKGYAAQRAVSFLRARGFPRVMVALAGDIVVGDPPPGRDGWRIAVVGERSTEERKDAPVLWLKNAAVSTSGDTEQFVEIGGKRYSHILDPATGLGMTTLRAVTVIAPTGEDADALATAACILGPGRGKEFLRRWGGVSAIFEEGGAREFFDAVGYLKSTTTAPAPR